MKKSTSSLSKPAAIPAVIDTNSFGQVFLIKGDTLTPESDIPENTKPTLVPFKSEQELNKIILTNRPVLFGKETVGLTAEIGAKPFPFDAFIFDFSNREEPRCFLLMMPKGVTVSMLALIAVRSYLYAIENRTVLIRLLSDYVRGHKASQKIFKSFLTRGQTIEAMLDSVIRKRLRALFLASDVESDNVKLFASYIESHSELFDMIELRKYKAGKANLLSVVPAFADLKEKQVAKPSPPKEKVVHTEDHHFTKSTDTLRTLYEKLKKEAIKIEKSVNFNPFGGYYIAMKKNGGKNLAFFHFRKTTIYLVVKLDEKIVRKMVKKSEVKSLPPSVQKFWNGSSTGLVFSNAEQLKEITEVLKRLIKQ